MNVAISQAQAGFGAHAAGAAGIHLLALASADRIARRRDCYHIEIVDEFRPDTLVLQEVSEDLRVVPGGGTAAVLMPMPVCPR